MICFLAHGGVNVGVNKRYMRGKKMNKKTRRNVILSTVGLVMLLAVLLLSPCVYQQFQRSIFLYVNPDFKFCNYNTFYDKYDDDSYYIVSAIHPILRDGGMKKVLSATEITKNTLCIQAKDTNGFIFPPHIGHFNPRIFITKTLSVEIYDSKSEKLLLKLYTWRGIFNYGYTFPEVIEKFKEGLSQAGWKEKKDVK